MHKVSLATLSIFLSLSTSLFAWNGHGHMVIAAIAARDLDASTKSTVHDILRNHPDYGDWRSEYLASDRYLELHTFIIMRASTWPDEIRKEGNPTTHPHWHYVNWPLKPKQGFPLENRPHPEDDVILGIKTFVEVFDDDHASAREKAEAMSWLIHLIGDIHQPLHCSGLIDGPYQAPLGDKGGNSFWVVPNSAPVKLHALWDGLLGTGENARSTYNDALRILRNNSRTSFGAALSKQDALDWSLESRGIAIHKGYLEGNLKGGTNRDTAERLPENYSSNAKETALTQAALAGYRLADVFKRVVR
jgi:hypothetical protein